MGPIEDCAGGRLAVHIATGAHMRVGGVCRDEGLRLGGDGREHAVLVEALAVGAPSVHGVFESRAANLVVRSLVPKFDDWASTLKSSSKCRVIST